MNNNWASKIYTFSMRYIIQGAVTTRRKYSPSSDPLLLLMRMPRMARANIDRVKASSLAEKPHETDNGSPPAS